MAVLRAADDIKLLRLLSSAVLITAIRGTEYCQITVGNVTQQLTVLGTAEIFAVYLWDAMQLFQGAAKIIKLLFSTDQKYIFQKGFINTVRKGTQVQPVI